MNDTELLRHYATSLLTPSQLDRLKAASVPVYGANGLRRYLAGRSFEAFVRLYHSDEFYLEFPPIHRLMIADCQQVMDRQQVSARGLKLCRVIPRGHSKTSFYARLLPMHGLLYGWSKLTVLLGNNQTAASRLLKNIKGSIESNEKILADFPELQSEQWNSERLESSNGAAVIALGSESGSIRGISNPYRPSLIIGDDLDSDTTAASETMTSSLVQWFDSAVMQLGDNVAFTTSFVVVGTLISRNSLLQHVIDSADFHSVIEQGIKKFADDTALWQQWEEAYIALAREGNQPRDASEDTFYQQHKEEMLRGAEVLWARPNAYYEAMVYKLVRPDKFQSEIQNLPSDVTGSLGAIELVTLPENTNEWMLLGALDPTSKGGKQNDYAAWVEILFNRRTKQMIVSYCDASKRNYDVTIEDVSRRILSNPKRYDGIFVEDNSIGLAVADGISKKIAAKNYVVTPVHNTMKKEERIDLLSPYIRLKQLTFANDIQPECINQFTMYPNAKHDDIPDSTSTIIMQLQATGLIEKV